MKTADPSARPYGAARSQSRTKGARPARYLLVAALLSLAALAAACSSSPSSPSSPSGSASSLLNQGLTAENSGQLQQAVNDFTAADKANPVSPIGYYDLGVIYQEHLNNPTKAAENYNKALLANPKYKPALYNLAILNTKSNPQQAINLYNQLLAINPKDPTVNFNLGLLLDAQGQTSQGTADLNKALIYNPSLRNRIPAGITP
jgi:tetratricopeptide (TPR) repeat protein